MTIEAKNITKTYGAFRALKNVSVTVPSGKLVALLGPSGSGKTTLLRIIAGLDQGDTGQVLLDGVDATELSARDRRVGFVFQHYALFRHMTVFDNIAFGLQVKPRNIRPSKAEIRTRVQELLNMIQLDWLSNRYPSQLSGGQRQRVALARALAVEPRVLLLDEPFGALDAKVRKELRRWLRRLHDEIHVTSVFVTHDVDEALEVADEVVVMNEGRIEQIGTPNEVYERPVNTFVYQFLGSVNLFRTRMLNGRLHLGERALDAPAEAEGEAVVHARPHDIVIERGATAEGLRATVVRLHAVGPVIRVELRCEGEPNPVEAELTRERFAELALAEGETVCIHPRRMRIFPAAKGESGNE